MRKREGQWARRRRELAEIKHILSVACLNKTAGGAAHVDRVRNL